MEHGMETSPPLFEYRAGGLHVAGQSVAALVQEMGTPLFIVSETRLLDNYHAIARGLAAGGAARVRYCAKTNNESGVLAALAAAGSEVLVAHPAEAQLALACGFPAERIAYQRPVLLAEEVAAVMDLGVRFLHVYRAADLETVERVAAAQRQPVRISLRLRTASRASRMSPLGFVSRRLGFGETELLAAVARHRASPWLTFAALNFYVGTQQGGIGAYEALLGRAGGLVARLNAEFGLTVEEINLGGGIPSLSLRRNRMPLPWLRREPAATDASPAALEAFCRALAQRARAVVAAAGWPGSPVVAAEPGRAVVGNAAVLITRVRAIEGRWAFLDTSRNHLAESSLLFSRSIWPAREAGVARRRYHLSGGTLNTLDVLDLARRLPPLAEGDVLAIGDAGAYSIARASRYAGLAPAVCLLCADGSRRVIRRAEGFADLTAAMRRYPSTGD